MSYASERWPRKGAGEKRSANGSEAPRSVKAPLGKKSPTATRPLRAQSVSNQVTSSKESVTCMPFARSVSSSRFGSTRRTAQRCLKRGT